MARMKRFANKIISDKQLDLLIKMGFFPTRSMYFTDNRRTESATTVLEVCPFYCDAADSTFAMSYFLYQSRHK